MPQVPVPNGRDPPVSLRYGPGKDVLLSNTDLSAHLPY